MKACTECKRHKWAFSSNALHASITEWTGRINKRGIYKCKCGATKYGEPMHTRTTDTEEGRSNG